MGANSPVLQNLGYSADKKPDLFSFAEDNICRRIEFRGADN